MIELVLINHVINLLLIGTDLNKTVSMEDHKRFTFTLLLFTARTSAVRRYFIGLFYCYYSFIIFILMHCLLFTRISENGLVIICQLGGWT